MLLNMYMEPDILYLLKNSCLITTYLKDLWLIACYFIMQRRIQDRRAGRAPPCLKFLGVVFVNFECKTRINFYCGHHTVFTICTLFSTVTKTIGTSKQTPDPKKSKRRDSAPRFWNSWIRHCYVHHFDLIFETNWLQNR